MRNHLVFGAHSDEESRPNTALPDDDAMNEWLRDLQNQESSAQSPDDGILKFLEDETNDDMGPELRNAVMKRQIQHEIVESYKLEQKKKEEEERRQAELQERSFQAMLEDRVRTMPAAKRRKPRVLGMPVWARHTTSQGAWTRYNDIHDASRQLKIPASSISRVANGDRDHEHGHNFEWSTVRARHRDSPGDWMKFNDVHHASRQLNIPDANSISQAANGNRDHVQYIFEWVNSSSSQEQS